MLFDIAAGDIGPDNNNDNKNCHDNNNHNDNNKNNNNDDNDNHNNDDNNNNNDNADNDPRHFHSFSLLFVCYLTLQLRNRVWP